MREHLAPALYYLEVHLLFASLVALAAWLLTLLPIGSARTKYWIWVGASANLFVPLAGLIDHFGAARFRWARPLGALGDLGVSLSRSRGTLLLLLLWLTGAALLGLRLLMRARRERLPPLPARRRAFGVPIETAAAHEPPAVVGLWRTRIRLPAGIEQRLSRAELEAVLLHEALHARRRDNLLRLLYEIGRCVLVPPAGLAGRQPPVLLP